MPTTLITPSRYFEPRCSSRAATPQLATLQGSSAPQARTTRPNTIERGLEALVAAATASAAELTLCALAIVTVARAVGLPLLAMTFAPRDGALVVVATVLDVAIATLALLAWSAARRERTALDGLTRAVARHEQQAALTPMTEGGAGAIANLARAIESSHRTLAGRTAEQLDFHAALAHDLRTPLTRIGLRCERIVEDHLRHAIERDLAEVNALVEDCLACCRAQRGLAETRRRVHLDSLLESLVGDYQDSGNAVVLDGQVGWPLMTCPTALRRVLVNLIDNALRYGDQVQLRVRASADQLVLAILDSGPGIAPEELEAVFAPWYRAAGSSERTQGSGLGLAIARRLTRSMDGELQLKNRERGGLEARLTLPLLLS